MQSSYTMFLDMGCGKPRAVLLFEFSVQHEFISGSKASGLLCCSFCMSFVQQGR